MNDLFNTDWTQLINNAAQGQPTNVNFGSMGSMFGSAGSGMPQARNPIGFNTNQNMGGSPNSSMFSQQGMFGDNGWFMPAVNTAMGFGNLYMGLKNYGLAKDSFKLNRDAMKTNLANQSKLVNRQIQSRQEFVNKYNPERAEDINTYMKNWGVSGKVGKTGYGG